MTSSHTTARRMVLATLALPIALACWGWCPASGQDRQEPRPTKPAPVVLECYYRTKWGHAEEFLRLYKKNHLPVMMRLKEEGRILKLEATKPRYHATEDGRWDYRVVLTFRDAAAAHDPAHEEAVKKQLYPDQEKFQVEERRRFEILEAHWDLLVDTVDLDRPNDAG